MMSNQITILGVPVDVLTETQALDRIDHMVRRGGTHLVVTANPEILDYAAGHPRMLHTLQSADLVTADGQGILLAGRLLGREFPERVTGIDLVEAICAESGTRAWRLYLLGAAPGVVDEAAANLRARYPDVEIVGSHHGYFRDGGLDDVLEDIKKARPDILLAGLGSPYQETFITRNQWTMRVPVAIGVGGSFDVLSGRVARAPEWVRRLRLEWLYRIASDPKRWRRALALPRFVLRVMAQRIGLSR